jgi:antitoxin HicB
MEIDSYTLMLSTDQTGAFRARVRELPEVDAAGATADDALGQARAAVLEALMGRMSAHREIPAGRAAAGDDRAVTLPLQATLKLALYREMRAQGLRKIDLARRLDWHPPQIDRLLDLSHGSRLDQIESGFRALGRTIAFQVLGGTATPLTQPSAADA